MVGRLVMEKQRDQHTTEKSRLSLKVVQFFWTFYHFSLRLYATFSILIWSLYEDRSTQGEGREHKNALLFNFQVSFATWHSCHFPSMFVITVWRIL